MGEFEFEEREIAFYFIAILGFQKSWVTVET